MVTIHYLWHAVVLILSGVILLRIAGRKSISQMTHTQTIVMISIGTIIVQPIVEKSVLRAIIGATIFVITILILEYAQVRSKKFEGILTGKAKVVIKDGKLLKQELKKMRLSIDQLEMRLRNNGVSAIEDIKTATIEPNGNIGFELMEDARPLTVKQFKDMMERYFPEATKTNIVEKKEKKENIFSELD